MLLPPPLQVVPIITKTFPSSFFTKSPENADQRYCSRSSSSWGWSWWIQQLFYCPQYTYAKPVMSTPSKDLINVRVEKEQNRGQAWFLPSFLLMIIVNHGIGREEQAASTSRARCSPSAVSSHHPRNPQVAQARPWEDSPPPTSTLLWWWNTPQLWRCAIRELY